MNKTYHVVILNEDSDIIEQPKRRIYEEFDQAWEDLELLVWSEGERMPERPRFAAPISVEIPSGHAQIWEVRMPVGAHL